MTIMSNYVTRLFSFFVGCVYLFLYMPILLLIIFSFNSDLYAVEWHGLTLRWYEMLWQDAEVWDALKNSLIVASSAVILSISMGTLFVFYARRRFIDMTMGLFYASLAVPEIVLAVGLLSFFYFFSIYLGLPALIATHTLLGLGYTVPILHARFLEIDKRIIEASYDLGATRHQTFMRVVLPLLSPAIITGALLVFIVSFDDFLLSFFCSGPTTQTLPIYIFALIRSGASPMVNALSTMLLSISSIVMAIFFCLRIKKMGTVS